MSGSSTYDLPFLYISSHKYKWCHLLHFTLQSHKCDKMVPKVEKLMSSFNMKVIMQSGEYLVIRVHSLGLLHYF